MILGTLAAAKKLNVSRRRVLALIKAKRLPAERLGNEWMIQSSDLALVRVRKNGRPVTKKTKR